MGTLLVILAVVIGFTAIRGLFIEWQKFRKVRFGTTRIVVAFNLIGCLTLFSLAVVAIVNSSWRALGAGLVSHGIASALGLSVSMMCMSPSSKGKSLVGLLRNLPWWVGILVSLIFARWLPFVIGVAASVVLYLLFPEKTGAVAHPADLAPPRSQEQDIGLPR